MTTTKWYFSQDYEKKKIAVKDNTGFQCIFTENFKSEYRCVHNADVLHTVYNVYW